jgi:cyclic pyranopterin monophosphate synthase
MTDPRLTHLDDQGNPRMVDVGEKQVTRRRAVAEGAIVMRPETLRAIGEGTVPKGNVTTVAELAGVMAAKRTSDLIPLCHPLPISSIRVETTLDPDLPGVRARAEVAVEARTGVEMEALTAVSCALLTIYDMCKALDRGMAIHGVRLVSKEGGSSGSWNASEATRPP